MGVATTSKTTARYGPLTKSINIDQTLMLIDLSTEFNSVSAWRDEALFRLPQGSRDRRLEIVRAALRKFLVVEDDRFLETPLRTLLTSPTVTPNMKRDLLYAQYLRTTPLVWEAVNEVVLPKAETSTRPLAGPETATIDLEEWMAFLAGRLNTTTPSTVNKTRSHITRHLTKFGILEAEPVPGDRFDKRFFARFYEPEPAAFCFSLALEFDEQGWTSRDLDFVLTRSWTRVAYCTAPAYTRFVVEEAERMGLAAIEFFGSEKQVTLRGLKPMENVLEAIQYG
jgi:hypothetical protein